MFPSLPLPTRRASSHQGGSPLLFSLRIKPQSHWLSPPVCRHRVLGTFPLLRTKEHPYRESTGWAILPQAKEELPNLF